MDIKERLNHRIDRHNNKIEQLCRRKDELSRHGHWQIGFYQGCVSILEDWLESVEKVEFDEPNLVTYRITGYAGFSDYYGPSDNNIDMNLTLDSKVTRDEVEAILRERYKRYRMTVFNISII